MLDFSEAIIPLQQWIDSFMDWVINYRFIFQAIKIPVNSFLEFVINIFMLPHPFIMIGLITALAYWRGGIKLAIFSGLSFLFIAFLGLWELSMTSLAMIVCSVMICTIIGIPLGILAARHSRFEAILRPILDTMQTIPSFAYLVPVVMLFSIGNVAGVIATIIFALPPIIRLTTLGIKHVDKECIEAARAYGASPMQVLLKVQLPLARPSIFAGLNQTIMMALSMVVTSALIGAGGLGEIVLQGLNTLEVGLASIGGIAIVLIAMVLDRITQSFHKN